MKIKRSGEEKDLVSKELYSATLHALLHFSLHSYDARAEPYSTRGPEPSGSIVVSAVVFAGPPGYIPLNCHLAWGLYRSVIAFNSPDNVRESVATVSLDGRRSAQIEYLQARKASLIARDSPKNDTTSLSLFSATPTRRANDKGVMTPAALKFDVNGYGLTWMQSPNGERIRRETAYDTVAYAILCSAQYNEDQRLSGFESISFPGGRAFVRFESFRVGHWPLMTWGFAATIVKILPTYLEASGFVESFFQVFTPDNKLCGMIGLFVRGNINDPETIDAPNAAGAHTS